MADHAREDLLNQAIDRILAGDDPGTLGSELDPLVKIARRLREMPADDFRDRLQNELGRRRSMTTAVTEIRKGFRTVTPYITVSDGDRLINFLKQTFGAEETFRSQSPMGFHAEVRIGDSMLMIGSGESIRGQEKLCAFHVYVADTDAAYRRAMEAGGTSMGEPDDRPYGERSGFVKDFAGNYWYIATRFPSNEAPADMGSVMPYLHPAKARPFIDFLKSAFDAEEMGVYEQEGRVMHAAVRIGNSVVEMGESPDFLPARMFLYVPDCDEWYRRAVAAGATSLQEPADQPYGHRSATVRDPFGFEWVPGSLLSSFQEPK